MCYSIFYSIFGIGAGITASGSAASVSSAAASTIGRQQPLFVVISLVALIIGPLIITRFGVVWVFASSHDANKLLPPLLTRFTVIHLKPYTKEEFVEIALNVLCKDARIEKDVARFIAEVVFDKLSSNIRECIRIASLAGNNTAKVQQIVDMLAAYDNN